MPEFTYAVTQNVHYYGGVDFDTASEVIEFVEDGDYDDKRNEVKWDRVQVYDADGVEVADTGPALTTLVHSLTVDGYGGPVCTMVFGTEQECWDALRERYLDNEIEIYEGGDQRTASEYSNEETLTYLTDTPGGYSIYFDIHEVTV